MNFGKALEALKTGHRVKLPSWAGYWEKDGNTIKMHCKDGRVFDFRIPCSLSGQNKNADDRT